MLVRAMLVFVYTVVSLPLAHSETLDIPAQPLTAAIDAFCAATGAEVYYDGAVAYGVRSSAVSGDHGRDKALQELLTGTDLVPLKVQDSVYLLINPGDDAARSLASAKSAQDARYQQYFAVVQRSVLQTMCLLQDRTAWPGRMVVRLWIDPAGGIRRVEADNRGEADGTDLVASLHRLRLSEPPPPQMPQPVTVALLPTTAVMTRYCAASGN